jgi:hypothetical protein
MKNYLLLISVLVMLGCSKNIPNGESQFEAFAPDGIPFVVADSSFLPDRKGNHRAVVKIGNLDQNAVVASIPWRRPDLRPETKKVVVYGMMPGTASPGMIIWHPIIRLTLYGRPL